MVKGRPRREANHRAAPFHQFSNHVAREHRKERRTRVSSKGTRPHAGGQDKTPPENPGGVRKQLASSFPIPSSPSRLYPEVLWRMVPQGPLVAPVLRRAACRNRVLWKPRFEVPRFREVNNRENSLEAKDATLKRVKRHIVSWDAHDNDFPLFAPHVLDWCPENEGYEA